MKSSTGLFLILVISTLCIHIRSLSIKNKLKTLNEVSLSTSITLEQADKYCNSLTEWNKTLTDLNLDNKKLIDQFKKHVELFRKWWTKNKKKADRDALLKKEKKYLDDFLEQAKSILTIFDSISTKMNKYKLSNCGKKSNSTGTSTNTSTSTSTSTSASTSTNTKTTSADLTKNANTLIQMIMTQYQELELKPDQDSINFLQIRQINIPRF
jgi:hypothetical protein